MARFDVYANPAGSGYLLDVQADLLDGLNTRVVVPLLPAESAPKPARRLNPVFAVKGAPYVMATQFLAAVPVAILKFPIASLVDQETDIGNALDMLFVGF